MKWLTNEPVWVGQWPMTPVKPEYLKRPFEEQIVSDNLMKLPAL